MHFARRASQYARDAAIAAQGSATTANATLNAMESNSERQLRAYLTFVAVNVTNIEVDQAPKVQIFVKNVGATPAHDVRIVLSFWLSQHPQIPQMVAADLPKGQTDAGILAPQIRIRMDPEVKLVLSAEEIESICGGSKAFYVVASVRYRDAFGKWCHHRHWSMYNKWNISSGKSEAHVCPFGNTYEYDVGEEAQP